jgi:hypothetical protein
VFIGRGKIIWMFDRVITTQPKRHSWHPVKNFTLN